MDNTIVSPAEYFEQVKSRKQTMTAAGLSQLYENCLALLDDIEYFRRSTCYDDIFETLAFDSWLYNHDTDVPFVTFALQGIQNETERYRYLQWLKDEMTKI